jgi:molybdopterin/thiamine biosynthesis adenylyltransferase
MQTKLEIIYGLEVANKIKETKALVVGAGGIGCELVKIMSMSGF